jgi:hypothetical protein
MILQTHAYNIKRMYAYTMAVNVCVLCVQVVREMMMTFTNSPYVCVFVSTGREDNENGVL